MKRFWRQDIIRRHSDTLSDSPQHWQQRLYCAPARRAKRLLTHYGTAGMSHCPTATLMPIMTECCDCLLSCNSAEDTASSCHNTTARNRTSICTSLPQTRSRHRQTMRDLYGAGCCWSLSLNPTEAIRYSQTVTCATLSERSISTIR